VTCDDGDNDEAAKYFLKGRKTYGKMEFGGIHSLGLKQYGPS
jgi:hypothetical protein